MLMKLTQYCKLVKVWPLCILCNNCSLFVPRELTPELAWCPFKYSLVWPCPCYMNTSITRSMGVLQIGHDGDLKSISATCLFEAFMWADPKSVKIQSSCQYLSALWGCVGVEASQKMLMKLTPVVNFTNILQATSSQPKAGCNALRCAPIRSAYIYCIKAVHGTLMKLTPVANVTNVLYAAFTQIIFCKK